MNSKMPLSSFSSPSHPGCFLSSILCLPLCCPHLCLLNSGHPIYSERRISSNMRLIFSNWKENYLLTNTSSLVTIRLFQSWVMATSTTLAGYSELSLLTSTAILPICHLTLLSSATTPTVREVNICKQNCLNNEDTFCKKGGR